MSDLAARTCAVPGCRRRALDGLLCRYGEIGERGSATYLEDGGHFAELAGWLHDIETEANLLSPVPPIEIRWDRGGGSLASQQSPAVLDAIVQRDARSTAHGRRHVGPTCARCRHDSCELIRADSDEADANAHRLLSIEAVLRGWGAQVREHRRLTWPTVHVVHRIPGVLTWHRQLPAPFDLHAERQLLSRQLDWIAEQDWVVDFRTEIGELRAQLQRANRNQDAKPLTGYCYRVVDDQGTVCGGNLWPVYTSEEDGDVDDGRQRPREVACDRNSSHRWKGGRYGDLAELYAALARQARQDTAAALVVPAPPPAPVPRSTGLAPADRIRGVLAQQAEEEQADRERAAHPQISAPTWIPGLTGGS